MNTSSSKFEPAISAIGLGFLDDASQKPLSFQVEDRKAPDVCVAFASRETAPGKFTFYKTLSKLHINIIYVNDYSNEWFLKGTPDFNDEVAFMAWLRSEINRLSGPTGKLFMLGASMGAYAALKYGAIFGADRIFAMGPESELCLPLGRSVTSVFGVKPGAGNIAGLPYKNPGDVLVLSGSNDIVDLYCASRLKEGNADLDVRLIRNRTHVVAKYIDAQFSLEAVICRFLETGDRSFLERAEVLEVPHMSGAMAMRIFNEELSRRNIETSNSEVIFALANEFPHWSMPQYFAALIFDKWQDVVNAELYLRRAVSAQKNLGRSRLKLAQILNSQKRWDETIALLEEQSATAYTAAIANTLSEAYRGKGDLEMAEKALSRL